MNVISNPTTGVMLTAAEAELIAHFRTTDARGKDFVFAAARFQAKNYPEVQSRPALRVIAGGAA